MRYRSQKQSHNAKSKNYPQILSCLRVTDICLPLTLDLEVKEYTKIFFLKWSLQLFIIIQIG